MSLVPLESGSKVVVFLMCDLSKARFVGYPTQQQGGKLRFEKKRFVSVTIIAVHCSGKFWMVKLTCWNQASHILR